MPQPSKPLAITKEEFESWENLPATRLIMGYFRDQAAATRYVEGFKDGEFTLTTQGWLGGVMDMTTIDHHNINDFYQEDRPWLPHARALLREVERGMRDNFQTERELLDNADDDTA